MDRVAEPYMVHDPQQMAGELLNGRWLVARWEHLGDNEDVPSWNAKLEAWCHEVGFTVHIVEIPKHSLTVAWNADLPTPTFDQIQDSISAVRVARFVGREIGNKLSVLTGRA